jgi:hypothetical protein
MGIKGEHAMSAKADRPRKGQGGIRRPSSQKGMNYGVLGPHPERNNPRNAFEIKELHRRLHDLPDDTLKQIPVLPEGSGLEHGATYIDLRNPSPREFTATGDMVAGPRNWYVPKEIVDYHLWNRLLGREDPERTGEGGTGRRLKTRRPQAH